MVKTLTWAAAGVAVAVAAIAAAAAQTTTPPPGQSLPLENNRPGYPTLARVMILNRTADEVVPVSIEANRFGPLPVSISGVMPVASVARAQRWEYRQVRVKTGDDPVAPLNGAGQDGWEAVTSFEATDGTVFVLKRPVQQ